MKTLYTVTITDNIKVDESTLELYGNWPVKLHAEGYVYLRPSKYRCVLLHRVLTNAPHGMDVDHINGDTKDNRIENLRIVTRQKNLLNRRDYPMKGVHYRKDRKKFSAQLKLNGVKQHLGYFDTAEDAHTAYLNALKLADRLLGNIK